jgi:hypothetical protein
LVKFDEFFIKKIGKFEIVDKKVGLFWHQNPKITDFLQKKYENFNEFRLLMEIS